MKVLIANPPGRFSGDRYPCPFPSRWTSLFKGYPVFIFFPYELAYLSSLLKRDLPNAEVKMVDGTWLRFTVDDYIRYIEYEKPDFVVFELDTVTYGETLRVIKAVKKSTGIKTIITGQYSTVNPAKVLEDGNDYACIGEYEEAVLEILKGKDPKTIPGVYPNSYRKVLDIDSLPDPEDDDIRRIDYSYSGGCRWTKYRSIEIHASRGCPYSCDFCVAGTVYYEKANWRFRSPGRIINEIETLRGKYSGIEGVFFNEETHIVKKPKILELCDAIVASGNNDLHYEAMANHLLLDDEILEALKRAGYYKLRIGIETIDPETSKSIGRKSKPDRIHHILSTAKKLGIELYGTFIIGASGSSKKGDLATVDFGKDLISKGLISSWQASIAVPHPGTPFHEKAVSSGWMNTDDPEKFNGISGSVVSYPNYSGEEIMDTIHTMGKVFEDARPAVASSPSNSIAGEKTYLTVEQRAHYRGIFKALTEKFDNGLYDETIKESEKLLEGFPYLLKAKQLIALSLEKKGETAKARERLEEIIELSIDYNDAILHAVEAHFYLGKMYLDEGDKDTALINFKKAMHLSPKHEEVRKYYWKLAHPNGSEKTEKEMTASEPSKGN